VGERNTKSRKENYFGLLLYYNCVQYKVSQQQQFLAEIIVQGVYKLWTQVAWLVPPITYHQVILALFDHNKNLIAVKLILLGSETCRSILFVLLYVL